MFVLPLGLEAKTKNFPWMTVAIFVATVVYSYLAMDSSHRFEKFYFNSPFVQQRFQKQKALAVAACGHTKLKTSDCEFLKSIAHVKVVEKPSQFLDRLEKAITRDKQLVMSKSSLSAIMQMVAKPEAWANPLPQVKALEEFLEYDLALKFETLDLVKHSQRESLLSRGAFSVMSLFRAQFLHGDWFHLIGNMAFFLLFAIAVEARIGALSLLGIYFVGGTGGLVANLLVSNDLSTPIMGASANVFAVAAAFMLLFWRRKVRCLVSTFFVFNQVVLVRTWVFFAVFMLMQEVTGAFDGAMSGIAHVAHLGGFAIGLVLAMVARELKPLSRNCVFPFESAILEDAVRETDEQKKMALVLEVLFHNPTNPSALKMGWDHVGSHFAGKEWSEVDSVSRVFLTRHFHHVMVVASRMGTERLAEIVRGMEIASWPMKELIHRHGAPYLLNQVRLLEKSGHLLEADRLAHWLSKMNLQGRMGRVVALVCEHLERRTFDAARSNVA